MHVGRYFGLDPARRGERERGVFRGLGLSSRICPATWAPISTTSSGWTIPVALIVNCSSPRWTGAVLKLAGRAVARCQYQ